MRLAWAPGWGAHTEKQPRPRPHEPGFSLLSAGARRRRGGEGEQNVSCTLVILEEGSAEGHGRDQGTPGHPHKRTRDPHGKPSVREGSLGSHLRRGPRGDGGRKGQGRSKVPIWRYQAL